jgi:hypothetical protein
MMKRILVTVAMLLVFAAPLFAQDVSTTGSFTANGQELVLDLNGHGTVSVQILGTWVATVQFSATVNGTDYFSIPNVLRVSTQTVVTSTPVNDTYVIASAGFQKVKVHTTAFTSGTVAVAMVGSPPVSFPSAITGGAASNVTVVNPSLDVNVLNPGLTDTELRATPVPVSASALPLPAGASTSVAQGTGNASLASIDGKLPALSGGRIPVELPAGGSGLTDAELRASPVPVSGPLTDTQLRATPVPVSGTVTTGGLTDTQLRASAVPVSAASLPLPTGAATSTLQTNGTQQTKVTDGTDVASVGADGETDISAKGLVISAYDRVNSKIYPLPVLGSSFAQPDSNTLAVPVDIRSASGLNGGSSPRNNMLLVGGRTNISSALGSQFIFGNGETVSAAPANTFALQTRDLGQSFTNSGNIDPVGQRMTVSNRYVNWAANVFTLSRNGAWTGSVKPVVSTDNGATYGYVSAINTVTGAFVSVLTDASVDGTYIIPAASGATDYGFEVFTKTSGGGTSVGVKVSANTGINSLFTATVITNPSDAGAYVRQDSTATIAKESGGNLATLAAKDFATSAKQDTGNASLASIDTKTPALVSGRVPVDGSGVTQPISGTVTANAGTGTFTVGGTVTANAGTNLNTSALALDATLTGGTQQTKITDGTNVATVKAASTAAVGADKAVVVAVSPNNSVAITAASLPLPTGAATETTLSALNTKFADISGSVSVTGSGTVTLTNLNGMSSVRVQAVDVASGGSPQTTFDTSADGTNWLSIACYNHDNQVWTTNPSSSAYEVTCPVAGALQFRTVTTGVVGGSITVLARASVATGPLPVFAILDSGTSGTIADISTNTGSTATSTAATAASVSSIDGKLPAVAALADNTANPTLTKLQNFNMVWDSSGSNWDRWTGGVSQLGNWSTRTLDGSGNIIPSSTSAPGGTDRGLNVRQVGLIQTSMDDTVTATGSPSTGIGLTVSGWDGTNTRILKTSATGELAVSVSSGTVTALAVGPAATGTAKSGAPVQTGAVFNTVQPTVTTGQVVENQATARGAQIVAPGVEGFTVTANAGTNLNTSALALDATLTNRTQKSQFTDGTRDGTIKAASTAAVAGDTSMVVALSPNSPLPAGTAILGKVGIDQTTPGTTNGVQTLSGSTTAVTQSTATNLKTQAESYMGGVAVSATNPLQVKDQRAATPAVTSVAGSATSVSCLASNANRLGATVYNDSTADLYVKLGATASTSSFTVKIFTDGFFAVPFGYTGVIDCIWSSAAGNARVTEVTQ